jgi:propionyl-CoA carboxylase beta chain
LLKAKFTEEYRNTFASPYIAAEVGFIDDVIMPHETRPKLINALESLRTKEVFNEKRKHGNIPL